MMLGCSLYRGAQRYRMHEMYFWEANNLLQVQVQAVVGSAVCVFYEVELKSVIKSSSWFQCKTPSSHSRWFLALETCFTIICIPFWPLLSVTGKLLGGYWRRYCWQLRFSLCQSMLRHDYASLKVYKLWWLIMVWFSVYRLLFDFNCLTL